MLRAPILAAARSSRLRGLVERAPVSGAVVRRFVAGSEVDDALRTARRLRADGLLVTLDHLGEDTTEVGQAEATVKAYAELLQLLGDAGLTPGTEVSVKLTALGLTLDPGLAVHGAQRVVEAASEVGTTVTLDMEGSAVTDATLSVLTELRAATPSVGAVLQAALRRTEADCRALATAGSRVRLCKGAYAEGTDVAFGSRGEVSASYARCLGVLMAGPGHPMVATHDPELVALAQRLAVHHGRAPASWELQMLLGVRTDEQRRLAAAGHQVRVYVPYGDEWYGYLVRRLAERPANLTFFLRALASRS